MERRSGPSRPASGRLTVVAAELIGSSYKVNFINFVERSVLLVKERTRP